LDGEKTANSVVAGTSQAKMAQEHGISQQLVSEDLKKLDCLWKTVLD
jgi:hypothetical protein